MAGFSKALFSECVTRKYYLILTLEFKATTVFITGIACSDKIPQKMFACDLNVKHSNYFILIQDEGRKDRRKALTELYAFYM